MTPTTRQRGKHPNDDQLFSSLWQEVLREAANDHSYLLTRGYGANSALELVGNRYKLNKRQRQALLRISASEQEVATRQAKVLKVQDLRGATVAIDGFNLLILLENAYSGAYVFHCRDNCYRDISSVHGSYKHIRQTAEAIVLVGQVLQQLGVASVYWYLDQPVSNSGRLKAFLQESAQAHNWNWQVELSYDPDKVLADSSNIVITSDGWVLDQAQRWFNLGKLLVEDHLSAINIVRV
ncbi:MAG: DUF434 domain-containing protein [Bacteroidota bacterium]